MRASSPTALSLTARAVTRTIRSWRPRRRDAGDLAGWFAVRRRAGDLRRDGGLDLGHAADGDSWGCRGRVLRDAGLGAEGLDVDAADNGQLQFTPVRAAVWLPVPCVLLRRSAFADSESGYQNYPIVLRTATDDDAGDLAERVRSMPAGWWDLRRDGDLDVGCGADWVRGDLDGWAVWVRPVSVGDGDADCGGCRAGDVDAHVQSGVSLPAPGLLLRPERVDVGDSESAYQEHPIVALAAPDLPATRRRDGVPGRIGQLHRRRDGRAHSHSASGRCSGPVEPGPTSRAPPARH